MPQRHLMRLIAVSPQNAHGLRVRGVHHDACHLLRRHKLPVPHLAPWPTEVHVVVRRKVRENVFFFWYPYPPGENMQKQGVYLKYMPLFAFLATHKFLK